MLFIASSAASAIFGPSSGSSNSAPQIWAAIVKGPIYGSAQNEFFGKKTNDIVEPSGKLR